MAAKNEIEKKSIYTVRRDIKQALIIKRSERGYPNQGKDRGQLLNALFNPKMGFTSFHLKSIKEKRYMPLL